MPKRHRSRAFMLTHAADFKDDAFDISSDDVSSAASLHQQKQSIIRALGDADWQQRRLAVERLRSTLNDHAVSAQARDRLLAVLFDALADTNNAGQRASALAVIESLAESALAPIAAHLETASAPVRIALTSSIGAIGGERAVRLLASLLQDRDPNVAHAAVTALGRTASTRAAALILDRLATEDLWLRFAAVTALGELGDDRACARLEELLDDVELSEAAAGALSEIASPHSLQSLVKNLCVEDLHDATTDGDALRFEMLEAIISLTEVERSLPYALVEHLRGAAQAALRALLDATPRGEQIFAELLRRAHHQPDQRTNDAQCALVALGWSGRTDAFAPIAGALGEPALGRTARTALAYLLQSEDVLVWLSRHDAYRQLAPMHAVLPFEIASALFGVRSLRALALCARLSREASDDEAHVAAAAALSDADEWLEEYLSTVHESRGDELLNLLSELREIIRAGGGQSLVEIASIAGRLASHLARQNNSKNHPDANAVGSVTEDLLCDLQKTQAGTDAESARLAFLDHADVQKAITMALRSQHHPHMSVRLRALEILEKSCASIDPSQLTQHLTDEEPGVRRAALRALRKAFRAQDASSDNQASQALYSSTISGEFVVASAPTQASRRDLRGAVAAALADDHIWVRLEAVASYGTMFGAEADVRAELRRLLSDGHPLTRVSAARTLASVSIDTEDWNALAELAQHDRQAEVRRAATQTFALCPDMQIQQAALSRSLTDAEWSVRRAAIETFAVIDNVTDTNKETIVRLAQNSDETWAVRGAACKSLAVLNHAETLSVACMLLATGDLTVVEDAFASLLKLRAHGDATKLAAMRKSLAETSATPRATMIVNFALA